MRRTVCLILTAVLAIAAVLTLASGCSLRRYRGPYVDVNGDFGGVDDLGRVLPLSGDVSSARDRKVGIFYFLWQGEHGRSGPHDNYKIVLEHPEAIESEEAWIASGGGKVGAHHFWGEPLFGYYVSADTWVMRKHCQLLTDAGVDFVVFDTTNAVTYDDRVRDLIGVWYEYLEAGWDVPKLAFYTNSNSSETMMHIYENIYKSASLNKKYPRLSELWYEWDGKPMIVGEQNSYLTSLEFDEYFTVKTNFWPTAGGHDDNAFPWMEFWRLYTDDAVYGRDGRKEVVNVSVAQHCATVTWSSTAWYGQQDHTRSWHDGANDPSEEAMFSGANFKEQLDWALGVDPEMIFITGWNEWVAQRQPAGGTWPIVFVDCCDPNTSRDIEPMNGLFGDNYYMQMIDGIRRYKGSAGRVALGDNITIDLDAGFDQWEQEGITARYTDYENDIADRSSDGFGTLKYVDTTGRNDIVEARVCRDRNNIYFYVRTAAELTPSADGNWMTLFLSTGAWKNSKSGEFWSGMFDYAVNLEKPDGNTVTLSRLSADGTWQTAGTGEMRLEGNQLMLKLSRKDLGIKNGLLDLQFKWADNYQLSEDGKLDIWSFYRNGDAAPLGRLTYVYSEVK